MLKYYGIKDAWITESPPTKPPPAATRRKAAKPATPPTDIVMIPVEKFLANTFNPNYHTTEQFQEYVAEVRRLGMWPKPTLVRSFSLPTGEVADGKPEFEPIIDGEHGWRAAMEVGLKEVPCQRSLLPTTSRRCCNVTSAIVVGQDDPVRLGLMFQRMQKRRGLTLCALSLESSSPTPQSVIT